ncbi:DUF3626 domain-containing protein [Brachybacterium sp. JHP9]|uniref:DUF3626 domain-containing protein n=1 Tax=Brachybacterium equifaecis TaxID=2910770 RepID=A0ABT0R1T8_9MICO|nr:DUF3626 domain-containing protein [Brachybacterium equifaecis]MCL6423866.1 DUF3626 domain-containing protein [Brachybacterium equifaecis]
MTIASPWAQEAVSYVDALCQGSPLPRDLRITLNFHPDRSTDGVGILDALAAQGEYRSQFETGTSNGGLTAHPGGDRWLWEQSLFGGAYDDAPAAERPKYGALNHRHRALGGAPRFGSSHLRLRQHMLDRATYCFPDSAYRPTHFATAQHFDLLPLAAVQDQALERNPDGENFDPLDGYVEAHAHGRISLRDDVEAIVMDPCFRHTDIEAAAHRLGLPVEWNEGRVLDLSTLDTHADYRGPAPVTVGHAIAQDGLLDARIIGLAVSTGRFAPQHLKQLWHLTAQWGQPRG